MHSKTAGGWVLMAIALDRDQKNLPDTRRKGRLYNKFCSRGRQDTELCHWALANPKEAAALMSEDGE